MGLTGTNDQASGQVRGLQKMVEEDRYWADVMVQISSMHEALRAVGRELMRNHLRHCASTAIRARSPLWQCSTLRNEPGR